MDRIDSRGGQARYRTHSVNPRDRSGEEAMFVFHTPYLTLPQVFVWILECDAERVRQVPENMKISTLHLQHVDRHLNAACAVVTAPDVDLSTLANIVPNDAPPKDGKLRNYLTQHEVGPDQLPKLTPVSLPTFGAALLDYLEGWYGAAGSSPDDAATLAGRDLHELDDWLAANGVRACLFEQAQQRIHNLAIGKAAADNAWDDALSEILGALGTGRIVATARKNGKEDPKPVPADYWSRLSFHDREFKGRGLQACAYYKADPKGDCWSDLTFEAKDVVAVWPAKPDFLNSTLSQAPMTKPGPNADAQNVASVGEQRRGRKPIKLEQVKQAMRRDISQGQYSTTDLQNMLEKDLAAKYGVSRDTARKARDAIAPKIVDKSILDK
jgi:Bacterial regulatory proteins, gntR family